MIHYAVSMFFAGLWAEVWRFGIGIGLIVLCLAAAYFSPILKKDFLYAAAVIAAFIVAFGYGVKTGETRVRAQWAAATSIALQQAGDARSAAIRDVDRDRAVRLRHDKYDRSQWRHR